MKVLTGLITALLVSLTALVFAPAAQARPYPHTVDTKCTANATDNPIDQREKPEFKFRITTPDSNAPSPDTKVFVTATHNVTGETVIEARRFYNGGTDRWTFKRLERGRYTFHFRTQTGERSVYENCGDSARLRVTR